MKRQRITAPEAWLLFFFLFSFLGGIVIPTVLLRNAILGGIGFAMLLYACIRNKNSVSSALILVFCLFFSMAMIVSLLYNHNSSIEDLLWVWVYVGPVLIMLTEEIRYRVFAILFYIIVPTLIVLCVLVGGESVFATSSRNNVSATALFYALLLYYYERRQTGKILMLPAVLTLVACVVGIGRSGLITGGLFFLIVLFTYCLSIRHDAHSLRRVVAVIVIVSGLFVLLNGVFGDYVQVAIANFEKRQLITPRTMLWESYIDLLSQSPANILLGASLSDSSLIAHYRQLHNSFFMLHARFGLLGLLFIGFGLLQSLSVSLKQGDFFMAALLVIAITRNMFDWCAFSGIYDVLFLYAIFGSLVSKSDSGKEAIGYANRQRGSLRCQ